MAFDEDNIIPAGPPQVHDEPVDQVPFDFELNRRQFTQVLGAGLLIAVLESSALGQAAAPARGRPGGGRGAQETTIATRLHIAADGRITVMSGKVECGQGARAQLTQAAAEELRVPVTAIAMLLADTRLVPNDGITAGSRTTPSTVPAVRRAAAAAREMLIDTAARRWGTARDQIEVVDGAAQHRADGRRFSYADLAADEQAAAALAQALPAGVTVTAVRQWRVMGQSTPRPNARDIVTGAHRYPSDIVRPNMLYGKVLRPPSYGARLIDVDLDRGRAIEGAVVVRDERFAGVAAANTFTAEQALAALAEGARWEPAEHPSSDRLFEHLRSTMRERPQNPFADELTSAAVRLRQSYQVPYVQHAPMEPRAAVAEWDEDGLTVWTATQNPFGVRTELARVFRLSEERVRVIVPDFGGGFGGKHTGETAVEAARLAQAAGRPVCLRWSRQEEFTWAYFRPAALIDAEASLDAAGRITSWHFININSGRAALDTPYDIARKDVQFVEAEPPLRHGSYRALAATANNFARECFMDELAAAAGRDPLAFRQDHLPPGRLRTVLEEAAQRFGWADALHGADADTGIGLACGVEKGSYVAACAEVRLDRAQRSFQVVRICQAYECGAIINPRNLMTQVKGSIVMGLGPALWERMRFEDGRIGNASFWGYRVPRFADLPPIEVHLLDRPDLPSAGGSETPIMAVAPAIANAVSRVTGRRVREMPVQL